MSVLVGIGSNMPHDPGEAVEQAALTAQATPGLGAVGSISKLGAAAAGGVAGLIAGGFLGGMQQEQQQEVIQTPTVTPSLTAPMETALKNLQEIAQEVKATQQTQAEVNIGLGSRIQDSYIASPVSTQTTTTNTNTTNIQETTSTNIQETTTYTVAGQEQQAEQSQDMTGLLMIAVAAIGAFFLLRKK